MQEYSKAFLSKVSEVCNLIDLNQIEKIIQALCQIKINKGRIFFIGIGGNAANASHAVNDFRKIIGIEAYSPIDNVSELTARVNDEGWDNVFLNWLITSNLSRNDALFVLSVGGGDVKRNISKNIVIALEYAKKIKTPIFGIVGRNGGYTKSIADYCILIPNIDDNIVTPLTESFQAIILHLIASHPKLKSYNMKWESVDK